MRFVLDCSVAISWCLPDESNAYADAVLILLSADRETVIKALYQDLDRSPKLLDFGLYVCPVVWG